MVNCPLCHRDVELHTLEQARRCLAVLQDRLGYCWIVGTRDVAPSASWAKWEPEE